MNPHFGARLRNLEARLARNNSPRGCTECWTNLTIRQIRAIDFSSAQCMLTGRDLECSLACYGPA